VCQGRGRNFGDAEVFSLTPSKLVTAGEGGLVVTRDAALAESLRALRNYGNAGDYNPSDLGSTGAERASRRLALESCGLWRITSSAARRHELYQNTWRVSGDPLPNGAAGNQSVAKDMGDPY